jgi:hypothetical protein
MRRSLILVVRPHMNIRRKLLWLALLSYLFCSSFYIYLLVAGNRNGVESFINVITQAALTLMPGSASASILNASDFAYGYWFSSLGLFFIISFYILPTILILSESKTSLFRCFLWLISFYFLGVVTIPIYYINRLYKSVRSHSN